MNIGQEIEELKMKEVRREVPNVLPLNDNYKLASLQAKHAPIINHKLLQDKGGVLD